MLEWGTLVRVKRDFDVVILGAGAAGLLCAIEAGKRGRRVAILERADRVGKKILISGGGRCNFTNLLCSPENFLSENPHFCKSALARFTPSDFVALVAKHGIPFHEKKPYEGAAPGQLFCDRSAQDIVDMLLAECAAAGVQITLNARVTHVRPDGGFVVRMEKGPAGESEIAAPALVVATGGLSIPKMGATAFGYEVAKQFGHSIVRCRPGLVPLTFGRVDARAYGGLAGVSVMVKASCGPRSWQGHGRPEFREKMLFTHRGLSGPAILQVSSYWGWKPQEPVWIDIAPDAEWTGMLRNGPGRRDLASARTALRRILPQRLADRWLDCGVETGKVGDWTNVGLQALEDELHRWEVELSGTEGYEKAEVTVGGVNTDELSSKSMESTKAPGLFFIGEVVDVTGWLGGFNFQWAWASGAAAGRAV
jgi:predicted Rossmann fold flavoprotein